ncbi:conserved Plasmodium protein, unknown function [Plasmodium ovale]|uniref:Uncharacterized protein n=2 Tax=Plasmodium ovale TaxID=36330 RepID=A0A1A8VI45_PLAOA|nr:conserved Plasmodium protein, unknown function [Plasmodium ovale curtisi]SBS80746.1 conserved Plasmodium protein, unknown function [Plasmodium ovale curtisi]SCA48279.1 conserved Plasmodium protein, unknown function [Plasmodium ovale]
MRACFVCLLLLIASCESYVVPFCKRQTGMVFFRNTDSRKGRRKTSEGFRGYMKRLRNATVVIDIENRKDLTKIEIIKMFMKGVKECKNVEYLREKSKGHVPPTTKRKLMKQKRMVNLRAHVKNDRIKKQEQVSPHRNILNFPKDQLKNINAAVLYFRHYFQKYETGPS